MSYATTSFLCRGELGHSDTTCISLAVLLWTVAIPYPQD